MKTRRFTYECRGACEQMMGTRDVLLQDLVIARMSLERGDDARCQEVIGRCLSSVQGIETGAGL